MAQLQCFHLIISAQNKCTFNLFTEDNMKPNPEPIDTNTFSSSDPEKASVRERPTEEAAETSSLLNANESSTSKGKSNLSTLTKIFKLIVKNPVQLVSAFAFGAASMYTSIAVASKNPLPWKNNTGAGPVNLNPMQLSTNNFNLTGTGIFLNNNSLTAAFKAHMIDLENKYRADTDSAPAWYTTLMNNQTSSLATTAKEAVNLTNDAAQNNMRAQLQEGMTNPATLYKTFVPKKVREQIKNAPRLKGDLDLQLKRAATAGFKQKTDNLVQTDNWGLPRNMKQDPIVSPFLKEVANKEKPALNKVPGEELEYKEAVNSYAKLLELSKDPNFELPNREEFKPLYSFVSEAKFNENPTKAAVDVMTFQWPKPMPEHMFKAALNLFKKTKQIEAEEIIQPVNSTPRSG